MAGNIQKKTTSKGDVRWLARFPTPDKRWVSKTFTRKIDAENWLADQTAGRSRGEWFDPRRSRVTFADLAESWLADRETSVATSTIKRDHSYMASMILPAFGRWEVGAITPEHIQRWVRQLEQSGKSPATVQKAFQLLSAVLDRGVARRRLLTNPAKTGDGVRLPRVTRHPMRTLTPSEVDQLAGAVDDRYRVMVLVTAYTGLRFGEIAGLTANRVDLEKRTIRVDRQLLRDLTLGPLKTSASARTLAIGDNVVDLLRGHLDRWPAVADGLVFTSRDGGPIRYSNFRRRVWERAVAATVGHPCRFHDLRHTHARWLIEAGEHPKTIQSRLGHSSIQVTLDRYASFFDNLDRGAADRLDGMLAGDRRHLGDTWPSGEVIGFPSKQ